MKTITSFVTTQLVVTLIFTVAVVIGMSPQRAYSQGYGDDIACFVRLPPTNNQWPVEVEAGCYGLALNFFDPDEAEYIHPGRGDLNEIRVPFLDLFVHDEGSVAIVQNHQPYAIIEPDLFTGYFLDGNKNLTDSAGCELCNLFAFVPGPYEQEYAWQRAIANAAADLDSRYYFACGEIRDGISGLVKPGFVARDTRVVATFDIEFEHDNHYAIQKALIYRSCGISYYRAEYLPDQSVWHVKYSIERLEQPMLRDDFFTIGSTLTPFKETAVFESSDYPIGIPCEQSTCYDLEVAAGNALDSIIAEDVSFRVKNGIGILGRLTK